MNESKADVVVDVPMSLLQSPKPYPGEVGRFSAGSQHFLLLRRIAIGSFDEAVQDYDEMMPLDL